MKGLKPLISSWGALAVAALAATPLAAQYYGDDRRGYDDDVRCESRDGRTNYCRMDVRYGVEMRRQHSQQPCVEGSTWGWDRNGVWVAGGCRATFVSGRGYAGPQPGWGHGGFDRVVRCESRDERPTYCGIDTRRGVTLVRQLSRRDCIQGQTWGWDRQGLWVAEGCRGEFQAGGQGGGYYPPGGGYGQSVRCESRDGRTAYCDIGRARSVELVRQLSQRACIEGRSWGWDGRNVWVADGCRAEFRAW